MKEKKNGLIIYNNNLNKFGLRDFTPIELNLWWSLIDKIKDIGVKEIFLSREEIVKLSNYDTSNRTIEQYQKDMRSIRGKLMLLNTGFIREDNTEVYFTLFPTFEINEKYIKLEVHRYFEPWFNNLKSNFTKFELQIVTNLKTGYTKELYRFLMQWQSTGYWRVSLDEFKELMNIPKSYRIQDIERKILKKASIELVTESKLGVQPFEYLVYDKIKDGRKTVGLEFKFKATKPKNNNNKILNIVDNEKTENSNENLYKNNYARGYIQGQSLTAQDFVNYLKENDFQEIDEDYFRVRKSTYKNIEKQYKDFVDTNILTEIEYLTVINLIINKGEPILDYTIETESYNLLKGKSLIPVNFLTKKQQDQIELILNKNKI